MYESFRHIDCTGRPCIVANESCAITEPGKIARIAKNKNIDFMIILLDPHLLKIEN